MRHLRQQPRNWSPPHCPNPKCKFHHPLQIEWAFKKAGFFNRRQQPYRIQRFTCLHCNRHFSRQTFSTTYWQKKPHLDRLIFMKTLGCMANRQIARDLNVSPNTVNRHLARLGRHCLLFHQRMMQGEPPPSQIVVDGFESFELSQYYPFHHHVAVEKNTDFFIYFTDSELRRKGRMTAGQKKRRSELERQFRRPDPQAIRKDMTELLHEVLKGQTRALVFSDEHKSYPPAIWASGCKVEHLVTSSRDHRDQRNPLWEVNLLDLLIRHSGANHKRETIAWSKRRQSSAERLAILLVWRNYMKGRREKDRSSPTPAMVRGMTDRRLTVDEILSERIFRGHMELPPRWADYHDRRVRTRALAGQKELRLKFAA